MLIKLSPVSDRFYSNLPSRNDNLGRYFMSHSLIGILRSPIDATTMTEAIKNNNLSFDAIII